jgi:hypothetical protein
MCHSAYDCYHALPVRARPGPLAPQTTGSRVTAVTPHSQRIQAACRVCTLSSRRRVPSAGVPIQTGQVKQHAGQRGNSKAQLARLRCQDEERGHTPHMVCLTTLCTCQPDCRTGMRRSSWYVLSITTSARPPICLQNKSATEQMVVHCMWLLQQYQCICHPAYRTRTQRSRPR